MKQASAPRRLSDADLSHPRATFDDIIGPSEDLSSLDRILYYESKTFLHGLLVVEDKLSMAHSLETRVPFLDNELVDLAGRIPVRYKLRNLERAIPMDENTPGKRFIYELKTNDGKAILRCAMSRLIP